MAMAKEGGVQTRVIIMIAGVIKGCVTLQFGGKRINSATLPCPTYNRFNVSITNDKITSAATAPPATDEAGG